MHFPPPPHTHTHTHTIITSLPKGKGSVVSPFRRVHNNFIVANYNALAGVNLDDGGARMLVYDNYLVYGQWGVGESCHSSQWVYVVTIPDMPSYVRLYPECSVHPGQNASQVQLRNGCCRAPFFIILLAMCASDAPSSQVEIATPSFCTADQTLLLPASSTFSAPGFVIVRACKPLCT